MRAARALALMVGGALWLPGATFYVTVTGLAGEPEYGQRFAQWAREIDRAARASAGARVRTLEAPRRDELRAAFEALAREASGGDALVLMLIGHGTFDGDQYKFNLPGPDVTAADIAALLDRVPASRQLVVNMTSASGGSLEALRRPGRIVVAATRTGTERNATVFARYWAEALRDPAADADKNETVSALEAFRYADRKTAAFYETSKRLATEHPVLEDTGKGEAARAPSPENGQGLLAAAFPLVRLGAAGAAARDPAKTKLLARKEDLEQQIDGLKYRKAAMPADEYKKQLAALLLELARTQEELEK